MRVLFCCTASDGHFAPLVPLARATRAAGHTVAFATGPRFCERVRENGFDALPVGIDVDELERRLEPHRAEIAALRPEDWRMHVFSLRFGEVEAPARFDDLVALADEWRPDAVVHESAELAAPIVAARLGLPAITHSFGRVVPVAVLERAAAVTAPLWRSAGLEPDPQAGAYRGTYVDIFPPSLQGPLPAHARVQPIRPALAGAAVPIAERPLVYVTLGTQFNRLQLLRLLLDAFADVDADVLMTVGRNVEPADVGSIPSNARVDQFIPQAEILPRAAAVVTHGGSGSTLGALAHGCPLLLLPQGADQLENAAACHEAGAGLRLMPADQTVENMRAGLVSLLGDRRYSAAAEEIAAEIGRMPSPDRVAGAIFPTQ